MGQIIFRALIYAPRLAEAPPEVVAKRRNSIIASREKTYRAIKNAVKTQKDFDRKIGQPAVDTQKSLIDPDFVTRSELRKKDIIHKTQDSTGRAFPEFKKGLKRYYKSDDPEKVNQALDGFVENYMKYTVPLRGYKKGHLKGLVYLGVMALTGDKDLKKFLRRGQGTIFTGEPICITSPAKKGKFRKDLASKLGRLGRDIIKSGYNPGITRESNTVINRLVEKYRLSKFAPFSPAPDEVYPLNETVASHIDFIRPGNHLYLGIQVACLPRHRQAQR